MNIQCDNDNRVYQNVTFRVIDKGTGKCVQEVVGHNQATNTMLTGIAYYLAGNGVLNQGEAMLADYVPRYISLGTMGLVNQDEDSQGLPAGLPENAQDYMNQTPGYGADGYKVSEGTYNNGREYLGLGPKFEDRPDAEKTINCELISPSAPRVAIQYRSVTDEDDAEVPKTLDVVFSAMISTGALAQFREPGKDYIFITEAGLWSQKTWSGSDSNGLLAGYRIVPPNSKNWDMTDPANVDILKHQILRVGVNQVVQVVWKIQLGALKQLTSISTDGTIVAKDTKVTLDQQQVLAYPSALLPLTATVIPPEDAPPGEQILLTWTTSDPSVATVEADDATTLTATVSFHGAGSAAITATANDGSEASAVCNVISEITTVDAFHPDPLSSAGVNVSNNVYQASQSFIKANAVHIGNSWNLANSPSSGTTRFEKTGTDPEINVYCLADQLAIKMHGYGYIDAGAINLRGSFATQVDLTDTDHLTDTSEGTISAETEYPAPIAISYDYGTSDIGSVPDATIIISKTEVLVITADDPLRTSHPYTTTLPNGVTVSGYIQYRAASASTAYGKYGVLNIDAMNSESVKCYIYQGTYAFKAIQLRGDNVEFVFMQATPTNRTVFCCASSFRLPAAAKIKCDAATSAYNFSVIFHTDDCYDSLGGQTQPMYIHAPNGEVYIDNSGTNTEASHVFCRDLRLAASATFWPT